MTTRNNPIMQPLPILPEDFLRAFFEPGEKICLRVFSDRKGGPAFKGMKVETSLSHLPSILPQLREHNELMRGVYFVVNLGGHEDADITRINAQFMECDDIPLEEQWEKITSFPLEPSIVVKTRKSLHTYWLTRGADVSAFRDVQKRLAAYFGGDRACVNESRVLRLPGFCHCKQEPVLVECVKFNPELRYAQSDLEKHLPNLSDASAPAKAASQAVKASHGLNAVLKRCAFMEHCDKDAETLCEHDWYAMITNLAVLEGGEAVVHSLSSKYPGYSAVETQAKIKHFLNSGTKPMTCAAIAEKGFKCPRMTDGSCPCKAPAAMRFQLMPLDELRQALRAYPVNRSPVEAMGEAKRFIADVLYNVDAMDASVFIDYEVKDHFRLRQPDVKSLIAYHKEVSKDYIKEKGARNTERPENLPDWYEVTERGGLRLVPGALAEHMAKDIHAFFGAGNFYAYDDGAYRVRHELWAANKARSYMLTRQAVLNAISDVTGQWKMLIFRPVDDINPNPYVLNMKNGLYNLEDGEFRDHDPAYLSTVQLGAAYKPDLLGEPDCGCPIFQTFVRGILDEPEVHLLQEIFGYLLLPVNKAQKSFVFVGAANAGKSTLLSVAQEILLCRENVSNIPWQNLSDRFNKAELFGKLANIFADLPSKAIDDNGLFKALTGEDYIIAERKNQNPFSFKPYARFLFSCNEMPRNYGDRSDGFFRRLILIRFNRSVPKSRRDAHLLSKLAAERDGILMWSLEGLKRLLHNGYNFSETDATQSELIKYKTESSSSLSFAAEHLGLVDGYVAFRDDVYWRYKNFCQDAGFKCLSQTMFNRDIEAQFPLASRGRDPRTKRRVWNGLRYFQEGKDADGE